MLNNNIEAQKGNRSLFGLFLVTIAASVVAQGIWSFRAQFILETAVFLAGIFWFIKTHRAGYSPAFSWRVEICFVLTALFTLCSALLSPVRFLVMQEWWNFAAGLFVLYLGSQFNEEQKKDAVFALKCCAWFVSLLAIYQGIYLKDINVSSSLTNPNALALFSIMLLPLALSNKEYALSGILTVALALTGSIAGWLALVLSGGLYFRPGFGWYKPGYKTILAACLLLILAVLLSHLELVSVTNRLLWWKTALRMFADRPLLGFGSGGFAYVYGAYAHAASGLSTIYAHNYYLEFLAENGLPAALCWFSLLGLALYRSGGALRCGLLAVFIHSFMDFGLAVTANFLIFCLLAGMAFSGEKREAENTVKIPVTVVAITVFALFFALLGTFLRQIRLERLRATSTGFLMAGDSRSLNLAADEAAELAPANALVPASFGLLDRKLGERTGNETCYFAAAVEFERSVLLNPYDKMAWAELEKLYVLPGKKLLLSDMRERKGKYFK